MAVHIFGANDYLVVPNIHCIRWLGKCAEFSLVLTSQSWIKSAHKKKASGKYLSRFLAHLDSSHHNLLDKRFQAWNEWLENLNKLNAMQVTRFHHTFAYQPRDIQLHVFPNPLEFADETAAYLKFLLKAYNLHNSYFMAKTKKKVSLKAISLTGLKINTKERRVKFSKLNQMVSATHAKFHKLLPFLNSYCWCKFQLHHQRCLRYNT